MRYMLDTNICIYLIKRQPAEVVERFSQYDVGDIDSRMHSTTVVKHRGVVNAIGTRFISALVAAPMEPFF